MDLLFFPVLFFLSPLHIFWIFFPFLDSCFLWFIFLSFFPIIFLAALIPTPAVSVCFFPPPELAFPKRASVLCSPLFFGRFPPPYILHFLYFLEVHQLHWKTSFTKIHRFVFRATSKLNCSALRNIPRLSFFFLLLFLFCIVYEVQRCVRPVFSISQQMSVLRFYILYILRLLFSIIFFSVVE